MNKPHPMGRLQRRYHIWDLAIALVGLISILIVTIAGPGAAPSRDSATRSLA